MMNYSHRSLCQTSLLCSVLSVKIVTIDLLIFDLDVKLVFNSGGVPLNDHVTLKILNVEFLKRF